MRLISQPGVDVGSGVWGIPLSAAEEKALDLSGRMAFAEAVSEDLLPFAKSLPSYGGAWIDQLAGGGLVVALTDVAPAVTEKLAALAPAASRGVRIQRVDHSLAELKRAAAQLAETSLGGADLSVVSVGIDEESNAVRLFVVPEAVQAETAAWSSAAARIGVPVRVVAESRGSDVTCTSRTNCYDPYKAGIRIRPGSVNGSPQCTLAFFIIVSSDVQVLTAGHCGYYGSSWYHPGKGLVGSVQATQYRQGGRDVLRMSVADSQASFDVYGFQNMYDDMRESRDPILNEAVCASLSVSDINDCGTVSDTYRSWVSETKGYTVYGADTTGIAPITGDSGSPVYTRFTMPAKPGWPQHSVFTPLGVMDHENGYFAIVNDALAAWGASMYRNPGW